eukprot:1728867-Rhodomonas_salina.1
MATGAWATGLCDCCGDTGDPTMGGAQLCCCACCCPCMIYGKITEQLSPQEDSTCGGNPNATLAYCALGPGLTIVVSMITGVRPPDLSCLIHTGTRGGVRSRYGIPGDSFNDCCCTCCCECCSLIQEYKQLKLVPSGPGGQPMQGMPPNTMGQTGPPANVPYAKPA